MSRKTIAILITLGVVIGVGLGVLIWWLVRAEDLYEIIRAEGDGIGDLPSTAAWTRIAGMGDMFWWFYPTVSAGLTSRPILLWLHGAIGTSPSFLANFGMFGPYDISLNSRNDSWVNDYNLLFVDAPLGTGFSIIESGEPLGLEENVEHILRVLQSFYDLHAEYKEAPLYICGQGDGAQLALPLAKRLYEENITPSITGLILGNPIISPALVLTKLGFYLEELGYVDGRGRAEIENFSNRTTELLNANQYVEAFEHFRTLGHFIDETAGAVAVNLHYIVEKVVRYSYSDFFMEKAYFQKVSHTDVDTNMFMNYVVAPNLGISRRDYDHQREAAIDAFRSTYMKPIVDEVEYILQNTDLTVNIYNGNLDAVSNTPGQLEWINNLHWSGQTQFLSEPRVTIVFNRLVEGYLRESERLRFYWINAAGQLAPYDNPVALSRVLNRILN